MADLFYVDGVTGDDDYDGLTPTVVSGAGGPWLTIQHAADTAVADSNVYVKASTTYTLAAPVDFDTNAGATGTHIKFIGYTDTIDDNGQVTIANGGGVATFFLFGSAIHYVDFYNFTLVRPDTFGIDLTGSDYHVISNCIIRGQGCSYGIDGTSSSNLNITHCEFDGETTGGSGIVVNSTGTTIEYCYFHDWADYGCLYPAVLKGNIFYNNDRACYFNTNIVFVEGNIFDAHDSGIYVGTLNSGVSIKNNIFSNNTTYGILNGSTTFLDGIMDYNAWYNNGQDIKYIASTPKGPHTVTLTENPYTTAGSDWTLNDTAGGGADCKNVGDGI